MEFGNMTDFDKEKYIQHWTELTEKAKRLAKTYKRSVTPLEVGISDKYDGERLDCRGWEMDDGFIRERIHDIHLTEAHDAEDYIMKVIKDGPKCGLCIWNDGGPKSCVHASVEECKHGHVVAEVNWTEDFMYTLEYVDVDWEKEEYKTIRNETEKVSFDGTGNRIVEIKCLLCGKKLDLDEISEHMMSELGEQYTNWAIGSKDEIVVDE